MKSDKPKEEEGAGNKKKAKAKSSSIPFGQGTRVLFDYLKFLRSECKSDQHFVSRLDIHTNTDLA